jgi:hypothetical protein
VKSLPSFWTLTSVISKRIRTGVVATRIVLTFIDILRTVSPLPTGVAFAFISGDQVNTYLIGGTRVFGTVVNVLFTVCSFPTSQTRTFIASVIIDTLVVITAWTIPITFINIVHAFIASPSLLTLTDITGRQVHTIHIGSTGGGTAVI